MDAKTYAIFKKVSESGGGADPVLQDKEVTITENGEITVEADSDYDGLSSVEITTIIPDPVLQDKEVTITENGETTVEADSDYDGLSSVEITTIIPDPVLQDKEVTITENGEITVEADSDYDGLSSVDITVAVPEPSGSIEIVENGTYDVTEKASAIVNVPSSGGGGVPALSKGVNFIDYDGTVVDTWETSIVASKTSLPDNPSHNGLTAQGWNWSLTDIKNYIATYPDALVTVGQMYITDDGKTRIYIHLEEGLLSPYLGICPNGSVDIDWGDNTTHDTVTGTSVNTLKNTNHTYAHSGDYTILLTVTGTMGIKGYDTGSSYYSRLLHNNSTNLNDNAKYSNAIQKIEIGANVISLDNVALYFCTSLVSITIPNSVTTIGDSAFYGCYILNNIAIPNSVTSIKTEAFYDCYYMKNVAIPNSVTSIGDTAFYNCNSLVSIAIPSSVTSIGKTVFKNCYALTYATIPNSVTNVGTDMFYGCHSIKRVSTSIMNNNEFYTCYSLKNIAITSNINNINNSAFYNCNSLVSITIPSSVTNIGDSAFYGCRTIPNVIIPNGVTNIGGNAFYNCRGLSFIKFTSQTPPTVASSNAFGSMPSACIIYVPTGTLSAYQSATNYPSPSAYTYVEY